MRTCFSLLALLIGLALVVVAAPPAPAAGHVATAAPAAAPEAASSTPPASPAAPDLPAAAVLALLLAWIPFVGWFTGFVEPVVAAVHGKGWRIGGMPAKTQVIDAGKYRPG